MRTTLTIPDDVYFQIVSMAKAADERVSEVVSRILRERLKTESPPPPPEKDDKFPFVTFPATGKTIDTEAVRRALEEDPFD